MNQGNLSQKDILVLGAFTGKRKTVSEVSQELDIPYQTLIRYTRKLEKAGYLVETGFRKNNQRFLTAIKSLDESPSFDPKARIYLSGEVLTIAEALNKFFFNPEVPIREDILVGLTLMTKRGEAKSQNEKPGGMSPTDVLLVFRRIRTKLTLWQSFLEALMNAQIWIDDAENAQRVGIEIPDAETFIAQFERRYMAEDKGPLER